MGRRKSKDLNSLAMRLANEFGDNFIEAKEAMRFLGYKSYPSFYSYVLQPMLEKGLIEKPFRGVIKVVKF